MQAIGTFSFFRNFSGVLKTAVTIRLICAFAGAMNQAHVIQLLYKMLQLYTVIIFCHYSDAANACGIQISVRR